MSTPPKLDDVRKEIEALLAYRNVDDAVIKNQTHLVPLLLKNSRRGDPTIIEMHATTLAVELSLVALDLKTACELLKPYLNEDRTDINPVRLNPLKRESPLSTATLLSVIADFLFRQRAYKAAYVAAERADALFKPMALKSASANPELVRLVVPRQLWNRARWARITWRKTGNATEAEQHFNKLMQKIEETRRERYMSRSRAHGIEAFALDFGAALAWHKGNLTEARSRIYRVLYLHGLRDPNDDTLIDSVRHAHALVTAAKIEASVSSSSNADLAFDLLERAINLFDKSNHPLRLVPLIQKAQVQVRIGDLAEAIGILDPPRIDPETQTPPLRTATLNPVHRAEIEMAWCWIHERHREWKEAGACAAEMLTQMELLSTPLPRLVADAHLMLGRSLIRRKLFDEGIPHLQQALKIATENSRTRTEVAAHLELTDAYHDNQEPELSDTHWDKSESKEGAQSAYLAQRRAEIAEKRGESGWTFKVKTTDYTKALNEFRQAFLGRMVTAHKGNKSHAADAANVSRSTLIKGLKQDATQRRPKGHPPKRGRSE